MNPNNAIQQALRSAPGAPAPASPSPMGASMGGNPQAKQQIMQLLQQLMQLIQQL